MLESGESELTAGPRELLFDHAQQLEYWVSLAVAAESSEGKHAALHAAVSCQALQEIPENDTQILFMSDASIQDAMVLPV